MYILSEKKEVVAELPFELQLFSEETPEDTDPETEEVEELEDDDTSDDDWMKYFKDEEETEEEADEDIDDEEEVEDIEEDLDKSEIEEVADPPESKEVQDDKTNRAFAEMRRQKEELERKAKLADELIAKQYGESHGIFTVEEYNEALQRQEVEEKYREAGADPEEIQKLVEEHPLVQQAKQQAFDRMLLDSYTELTKEYPDVKTPEDIKPEVWQKWNEGKNGLTLSEAHFLVNKDEIIKMQRETAKINTVKKINSKSHIKSTGQTNSTDIDTIDIPRDVYDMYKRMMPEATKSQILKHYKKSIKG